MGIEAPRPFGLTCVAQVLRHLFQLCANVDAMVSRRARALRNTPASDETR